MPELYVLSLCCELNFGGLTVHSLNVLHSVSAEAELWNVSTDVDLLSIAGVFYKLPFTPQNLWTCC